MRVAITGSHGLIGSALIASLERDGHDVVRLVRGEPSRPGEVRWDPQAGTIDVAGLTGIDAAVNLAGAGVGDHRWSDSYKQEIYDSRILGTRTLVQALSSLDPSPRVLVSAAAIGFYGDRGDEVLTEDSHPGHGFLAGVVEEWEAEARVASEAGIRVATIRTGLVMARQGGAFAQIMLLAKFGLAGPMGNGRQWWSWITLDDQIRAIRFLIDHDVSGPVNLTGPAPAPNREVIRAIARTLKRPSLVPAPAFALKLVLGEFASEILISQRVMPAKLLDAGFAFHHTSVEDAAAWTTGRA